MQTGLFPTNYMLAHICLQLDPNKFVMLIIALSDSPVISIFIFLINIESKTKIFTYQSNFFFITMNDR